MPAPLRMRTAALAIAAAVAAAAVAYVAWGLLQAPSIEIHGPVARLTPRAVSVSLVIRNHGLGEDCLIAASVVEPFGSEAEIHRMVMKNGAMEMQPVGRPLCVPGRSELVMDPAVGEGYHIMILGNFPQMPEKLKLVLRFAKTGDVAIDVPMEEKRPTEGHGH